MRLHVSSVRSASHHDAVAVPPRDDRQAAPVDGDRGPELDVVEHLGQAIRNRWPSRSATRPELLDDPGEHRPLHAIARLCPFGTGPRSPPVLKDRSGRCVGSLPVMAIDFSLTPELEEIRARTRAFVDDVIKPTEQKIHDEHLQETDRKAYLGALLEHAQAGQEAGIWLPHMPEEWGGMGLGHVAAGDGPGRGGQGRRTGRGCSTARRPTRATCTRCCTGAPTSRRSSTSGRCATGTAGRASR